jgi:DNA topoisomerase-1
MNTLVICEKKNAAKRIASILSSGKARENFSHGVPFYSFNREDKQYLIIGLRGHILELDFPEEYRGWHRIKPRELIWIEPRKRIAKGSNKIVAALKDLAGQNQDLIVATDYDREGELIGVEALNLAKEFNPDIKAKRARFSALTEEEVNGAFKNLVNVDLHLSDSAMSRQIVDLAWGATLTRFISIASNQGGRDFLSVGRVQSPTLALLVDREKDIRNFKPEPFWVITAEMEKSGKFSANHQNGKFNEEERVREAFTRANATDEALVSTVKSRDKKDKAPIPYSTTTFLRDATRQGLSAAKAMSIAEDLYTDGLISYPRTDNTVYPKSLNLREILEVLKKSEFVKEATDLSKMSRLIPSRGKTKTTDHPPIHPAGAAKKGDLNRNHWKVYELVTRRFLATLASDSVSKITDVGLDLNGEMFVAKGLEIIEPGWRRFFPYYDPKEVLLPQLKEKDHVHVLSVDFTRDETKPPGRYGQGTLIGEMERLGLGTKSTRHEIIQKLYMRGYVKGSPPKPTPSGIAVIEALEEHARAITRARMTSTLESDMDLVAEGKKDFEEVVRESQDMLDKVFILLEENMERIGSSIKEALKEQNIIGTCTRCGGDLQMMRSYRGKRFVGCSGFPRCRNSYPLPQRGKLTFLDMTCELCGAPVIKLGGKKGKGKEVCINMRCQSSKAS